MPPTYMLVGWSQFVHGASKATLLATLELAC